MTTIGDTSDNALWDMSVSSKSWVELVDSEEEKEDLNCSSKLKTPPKDEQSRDMHKIRSPIKQADLEDSLLPVENKAILKEFEVNSKLPSVAEVKEKTAFVEEEDTKDGILPVVKIECPDSDPPLKNVTQTYANILKSSPEAVADECRKIEIKTEVKKELVKEFLHDDISLTGHLDGFKLNSPAKTAKDGFKTPNKPVKPAVRSSPRLTKRKILDGITESSSDESLKPSPSKIARTAPTRNRITPIRLPGTPVRAPGTPTMIKQELGSSSHGANRKRPRDNTPNDRRYSRKEQETDPDVLARRRKQIDYGKNTIGYERYRELVPKESRQSIHPKTPPMHMKYSRRAWDGLVRIWRQRLHFWDPPSEGGGDPALLEEFSDIGSEMSEMSDTGSLPSTPVQDWKRRAPSSPLVTRGRPQQDNEEMEEDFQNQGCCPLPSE